MEQTEAIVRTVQQLCRRCGSRDPFVLAEESGIHILHTDALNRLKGMYRVIKRNRFIILNAQNSEQMNRIVCAHELGHDQLHREYAKDHALQEFMLYDMSTRQEYEANIFAASLLLEDSTVMEMMEAGLDTVQIAAATETDINLVALKTDCLIRAGYDLRRQEHDSRFLR